MPQYCGSAHPIPTARANFHSFPFLDIRSVNAGVLHIHIYHANVIDGADHDEVTHLSVIRVQVKQVNGQSAEIVTDRQRKSRNIFFFRNCLIEFPFDRSASANCTVLSIVQFRHAPGNLNETNAGRIAAGLSQVCSLVPRSTAHF